MLLKNFFLGEKIVITNELNKNVVPLKFINNYFSFFFFIVGLIDFLLNHDLPVQLIFFFFFLIVPFFFSDMLTKEKSAINEEIDRQNASTAKIVDERKSKKSKSDSKKSDFDEWMEKKAAIGLYSSLPPVNALHNMRVCI